MNGPSAGTPQEIASTGAQRRAVFAWALIAASVAAVNLSGAFGAQRNPPIPTATIVGSAGTLAALLGITLLSWSRSRGLAVLAGVGHGQIALAISAVVQVLAPLFPLTSLASPLADGAAVAGRFALAFSLAVYGARRLRGASPDDDSLDASDAARSDGRAVWAMALVGGVMTATFAYLSSRGAHLSIPETKLPQISSACVLAASLAMLAATRVRLATDAWIGTLAVSSSAVVLPVLLGRPWAWSQALCLALAQAYVLIDLIRWLSGRFMDLSQSLTRVAVEALMDGLTGIPNRRGFDRMFADAGDAARRTGRPFAVALLDIDQFKKYNDEFGHLNGDQCLRDIARTISASCIRPSDAVARYGGEEFAIILPGADTKTAAMVAERVREVVQKLAIPHAADSGLNVVTVSIGCCSTDVGARPEGGEMLRLADEALYQAKDAGRNRVVSATCRVR